MASIRSLKEPSFSTLPELAFVTDDLTLSWYLASLMPGAFPMGGCLRIFVKLFSELKFICWCYDCSFAGTER